MSTIHEAEAAKAARQRRLAFMAAELRDAGYTVTETNPLVGRLTWCDTCKRIIRLDDLDSAGQHCDTNPYEYTPGEIFERLAAKTLPAEPHIAVTARRLWPTVQQVVDELLHPQK